MEEFFCHASVGETVSDCFHYNIQVFLQYYFNFIFCLFGVFELDKLFYFLYFDFQTAVVPHVSLDIHHADFGRLQDPKSVEQKVQYFLYLVSLKLKTLASIDNRLYRHQVLYSNLACARK